MPELSDGMIPIRWNGSAWVKADIYDKWYDYDKQEWANVVLVTESTRNDYKNASPETEILETDVLAYLVWIPRYRYKLFNVNSKSISPREIEIEFEDNKTLKLIGSSDDEWLTHPAFTFGTDELNGIWVGKFETTGNTTTPTVKPGNIAIHHINAYNQFITARKFNNEAVYGLTNQFDAHMMKNTEWGAVAYLSHSKYGKYGNSMYTGENKEIYASKSSSSITGLSNGTLGTEVINEQCLYSDTIDRGNGMGACGAGASTTGNIYGIYDMAGGALERVMGLIYNSDNLTLVVEGSGFMQEDIDDIAMTKYVDKYLYGTSSIEFNRRKLGDATGETRLWYNDSTEMVTYSESWFHRGGIYNQGDNIGIFYFGAYNGGNSSHAFRLVISGFIMSN